MVGSRVPSAHRQRGRQAQALRRDLPLERRHQVPEGGLGVTCFDLYSQGDANGVNASHAKQLVKIRDKEAKVQAKIVELNKLKAPKEPVVVDSTPIAVPIAEVPPPTQTMAVPVPPDASPGQQIAVVLPDGKTVQAVVPPNAVPGTVFHIQV